MRTWAVVAALAFASPWSLPVAAQDVESLGSEDPGAIEGETEEARTERARALFGEGIDLVEEERWEEAASRFRAALELKEAPAVRYNLASALYGAGQMTEAEVLVDEVLDDPDTDETLRGHAQELQSMMRENSGILRVELSAAAAGSTVTIDGYELPNNRIGIDVAAAPGSHVVTATRDGREVARENTTVTAGQTTTVRLDVAPTPESTAGAGLDDTTGGDEPGGTAELWTDWRLWAGVGAAVLVVVGIVVVVAAGGGGTQDPVEGNFEPGVLRW